MPILEFGTEEQKKEMLPDIAQEGRIRTLGLTEASARYDASDIELSAKPEGDRHVLTGTKLFVPYANAADQLLILARTSVKENPEQGLTLFIVDSKSEGVEFELIPTAARDARWEVGFDKVGISSDCVLGRIDDGWGIVEYILQHAAVLKSAEMLGGAQAVLNTTIDYAKERVQFGKTIGSFQTIQHKLADLLTEVEGLKCLVYEAAWKIENGNSSPMLNSMVKVRANEVYHRACYCSITTHGAIGWAEELDVGLYHLRTRALNFDAGTSDLHKEWVARELENYMPEFIKLQS